MDGVQTRPLMSLKLQVTDVQPVGLTPAGERRVALVESGTFTGSRLAGTVLPGGADWIVVRGDGCMTLDVRLVLQTGDGALIGLTYRGMRHGPADVMARMALGESVDPASYYFRTIMNFETTAGPYDWLNRIFAIGIGQRLPAGPHYEVHELL